MKALSRLIILVLLFLVGCGYHPMGAEPIGGPTRLTMAVPAFANRSTEVGLEAVLSNALITTFAQTRAVKVTPFEEGADLVLEGKVHSLDNTSVAYQDVTNSTVRRVTLRVELTLKKQESGKVLWKDTEIFQEDYVVDPNYHAGEATKSEGLRRAAVKMARKVRDKVLMVI
ncbi:MAG: LPS assembly lipoprotein LptE [Deltaproteobacteria bacterium]|nr:LPS assembly lipoprotein LptE [Deltaproteobacteria bacterium]